MRVVHRADAAWVARAARAAIARHVCAAGLAAFTLAGCGGGGSGAGSQPTVNVAVTAANRVAVSRAAFGSLQTGLVGGVGGPTAGTGASALAVSLPGLKRVLSTAASGRKAIAAQDVSATFCVGAGGGSASATVTDTPPLNELNVNDGVAIVFTNCDVGSGLLFSGGLGITYTVLSGAGFTANIAAGNFLIQEAATGYAATMNGGFTLTLAESAGGSTSDLMVPEQLSLSARQGGVDDTVTLLDHYVQHASYVAATTMTTITASGPVASAAAGGFVRISTPQPLLQLDSETFPHAGQLVAVGLRGKLQATVQSASQVLIELDADDSGSYELTETVLWTALI